MHFKTALLAGLLQVVLLFTCASADTAGAKRDLGVGCAVVPELQTVRPLDFGDTRIVAGHSGFLMVSPRGEVAHAASVLVYRMPQPAELSLCGDPHQDIAIVIEQPSLNLHSASGYPIAREVTHIKVEGSGIALTRTEPGRWEGRLSESGRAKVLVGATLYLSANGTHGTAGADISIDVVTQ